jgi:hypothetical protein
MYTTAEASRILDISIRVLQTELKRLGIKKIKNRYIITDNVIEAVKRTQTNRANENERNETKVITETFSTAEYEKLQSVINEYPSLIKQLEDLKNQNDYLKTALDKSTEQITLLITTFQSSIRTIEQRNFLEAKNKS